MVVTINGTRIAGWLSNLLIVNAEAPTLMGMYYELVVWFCCTSMYPRNVQARANIHCEHLSTQCSLTLSRFLGARISSWGGAMPVEWVVGWLATLPLLLLLPVEACTFVSGMVAKHWIFASS